MIRAGVSSETRELAERLVAHEAATESTSYDDAHATCRVCEKLRRPLSALAGTAGYRSLFSRALTLAQREAPELGAFQINMDGSLDGLEGDVTNCTTLLVSHLLSLLSNFIGDTLLLRLLHDVWPDLPGVSSHSAEEEKK